jgi:hypothetical protein
LHGNGAEVSPAASGSPHRLWAGLLDAGARDYFRALTEAFSKLSEMSSCGVGASRHQGLLRGIGN